MMWGKRGAAVVVAAGLIVGAVLFRSNVIEGDDAGSSTDPGSLVCLVELARICEAAGVEHRTATVAELTAEWSDPNVEPTEQWFTVAPLPEVMQLRRGNDQLEFDIRLVAASPLALVVPATKSAALQAACPGIEWRCVGERAGQPWGDAGGTVRPALPDVDSAVGQVAVTAAIRGFFGNASITSEDPDFISWSRRLHRVASRIELSAGTPIATLLTRPSALDVAVGPEADLANSRQDGVEVLYAAPMTSIDLVLAGPGGVAPSGGLLDDLQEAALAAGWQEQARGDAPPASDLIAAVAAWERL